MSFAGILAAGRTASLQTLAETCTIDRITGKTFDESSGKYTDTTQNVYTGACRLKVDRMARPGDVAGSEIEVQRYDLQLPATATMVFLKGDVATMTASDDTSIVGRSLNVITPQIGGSFTKRHLIVEDVT